MRHFYDIEHRCVLTERELQDEFVNLLASEPKQYKHFDTYIENCLTINNGTLIYIGKKPNYEKELHQCIIEDAVWKEYYTKHYKGKLSFNSIVKSVIDYVFHSEFNPYLEKRYLDISWLNVDDGVYLNLDDIWEEFCYQVMEI